jgi:hypothetical protein
MNMLGCCFGTGPTRVAFGYGSAAASQPSASAGFSKGKSSSGAGGGRGGHSGNGADVKPFLQGKSANLLQRLFQTTLPVSGSESLVMSIPTSSALDLLLSYKVALYFLCFRLI